MSLIAANTASVLGTAAGLQRARAGQGIGGTGGSSFGDPGAGSAMDGFIRALSTRAAALDHLVGRAAAVLAVYAVNFERAGT